MRVKKQNPFESIFHDFVTDFGGQVLPEAHNDGGTADYIFPKHDIIAELKSLTVDQTENMNQKVESKVVEWIRRGQPRPPGNIEGDKYWVQIKDMPREIRDLWFKLLKASVDTLIREANRQIRDTKTRMGLPSAKGLLIIANQSNPYHDHPESYRRLVAEILRKRTQTGELRYPHINGAVYFSLKDVKSRDEGMYFWANLQIKQEPDEDVSGMAALQNQLRQAWYGYIERTCEITVRQHHLPISSLAGCGKMDDVT